MLTLSPLYCMCCCPRSDIHSIGVAAASSCVSSGRSECTAHDILSALSEMGVEFAEMRQWKELSEPAPFLHVMPPFPLKQPVISCEPVMIAAANSAAGVGVGVGGTAASPASAASLDAKSTPLFAPRPPHIPLCLPAFPPRRTYVQTADLTSAGRSSSSAAAVASSSSSTNVSGMAPSVTPAGVDPSAATRKRRVRENRLLESALVTLHQAAAKAALEQAQAAAQQEIRLQEAMMMGAAQQQQQQQPPPPPAAAAAVTLAPAPASAAAASAGAAAAAASRSSKPSASSSSSSSLSAAAQVQAQVQGPSAMEMDDADPPHHPPATAAAATVASHSSAQPTSQPAAATTAASTPAANQPD